MLGGPPANFPNPPYIPHPFRPAAAVMNTSRFDEGYSEDTRSQHETDMIMGAGDSGMEPDMQQFSLPDWIMGLDEQQRSGMSRARAQPDHSANEAQRNSIRHPTVATNLVHRQHRRETQPAPAP